MAKGVRDATQAVPLRPNVVHPITRENTKDNTGLGMPAIHVRPGERLTVTVLPKGAGAENMSRIVMLLPSQKDQIPHVVAETMLLAGGKPCPPVILGVGIGGTFDGAAALAKEALLLPVDTMDEFEQELCDIVNELGIGPMGLGGKTTALAVKVKTARMPYRITSRRSQCPVLGQPAGMRRGGTMTGMALCTPLGDEVLSLRAGDRVTLSGRVYTARDEAHLRMMEEGSRSIPGCGDLSLRPGHTGRPVIAAGPTLRPG